MTLGYHGEPSAARWNPPLPSLQQVRKNLIDDINTLLASLPIQQQTVIVAVRWELDGWSIDILFEPPSRGRYDGWAECLIDFDQYHGPIDRLRCYTAEALAEEVMDQRFPGWPDSEYGHPEPVWDKDQEIH